MKWNKNKSIWPFSSNSMFYKKSFHYWHLQDMGKKNKPTILFIHGTGASSHSWRSLIPFFKNNFRIINLDLPGHGFTKLGSKNRSSLKLIPKDLFGILTELKINPEIIIAHSAGVPIALNYVALSKISPKLLISINGAVSKFDGAANIFFPLMAKLLSLSPFVPQIVKNLTKYPMIFKELIYSTGSNLDNESIKFYKILMSDNDHINGVLGMMSQWDLDDLIKDFDNLKIPILFLIGKNDKTVKSENVIKVIKDFKNVKIIFINKLGHLMHEECPEIIYQNIENFLNTNKNKIY